MIVLVSVFVLGSAFVWRFPRLWIAMLLTAIPVLDLAPLTGLVMIDEIDALVLACAATFVLRGERSQLRMSPGTRLLMGAGIVATVIALSRGLIELLPAEFGSYQDYMTQFNALRVFKPILWIILLQPALAWSLSHDDQLVDTVARSATVALIVGSLLVIYEHTAFAGAFALDNTYRVSGGFWSMNVGDGHIGTWLVMMTPFTLLHVAQRASPTRLFWAMLALASSGYCFLASGARGGLFALLAAFICFAVLYVVKCRPKLFSGRAVVAALAGFGILLVATVALLHSHLFSRMSTLTEDFQARVDHWHQATALVGEGASAKLFGRGLGTYPLLNQLATYGDGNIARVHLVKVDGQRAMAVAGASPLYVGRHIRLMPSREVVATVRYATGAQLSPPVVLLCSKWLMTSFDCYRVVARTDTPVSATVTQAKVRLAPPVAPSESTGIKIMQTQKLSIAQGPSRGSIVNSVRLSDAESGQVLLNHNFSSGLTGWLFQTDDHLVWHASNILVSLYVEIGLMGTLLFVGITGLALWRLGNADQEPFKRLGVAVASSLVGALVIGGSVSIIDQPRLTLIFLALIMTGFCWRKATASSAT
jgi:hypothetical protein